MTITLERQLRERVDAIVQAICATPGMKTDRSKLLEDIVSGRTSLAELETRWTATK